MTGMKLLRKKIDESGYRMRFIADKLGISYQGFLNKLQGNSEFKASEIQILSDLLHLTSEERTKIFFTFDVE